MEVTLFDFQKHFVPLKSKRVEVFELIPETGCCFSSFRQILGVDQVVVGNTGACGEKGKGTSISTLLVLRSGASILQNSFHRIQDFDHKITYQ